MNSKPYPTMKIKPEPNIRKMVRIFAGVFLVTMVAIGIGHLTYTPSVNPPLDAPNSEMAEQAMRIELAVHTVRDRLKDPDSLKIYRTWIGRDGNVCLVFSGTNGFGARVKDVASVEKSGFVLMDNPSALQGACNL